MIKDMQDRQRSRLSAAAYTSVAKDPNVAARENAMADQMGVDVDLVRGEGDEKRKIEVQAKYDKLRSDLGEVARRDPNTANFLSTPNTLEQSHDDIGTFKKILDWEGVSDYTGIQFDNTMSNRRIAPAQTKEVMKILGFGGGMTEEERKMVDYERSQIEFRGPGQLPDGVVNTPLAYIGGSTANLLPFVAGGFIAGAEGAGFVGGVAGTAHLVATKGKNPGKSFQVAKRFGKAGGTLGQGADMFQIETGLTFEGVSSAEYDGEKLDPWTAAVTSATVGVINAGIEVAQWRVLMAPWQELAARKGMRSQVNEALKDSSVRLAIKNVARRSRNVALFEGGTESFQESVQAVAEILARKIDFGQAVMGEDGSLEAMKEKFPHLLTEEEQEDSLLPFGFGEILNAGFSAATGSIVIGLPGNVASSTSQAINENRIGEDAAQRDRMDKIMTESALAQREGGKKILAQAPAVRAKGDIFIEADQLIGMVEANPEIVEEVFEQVPGLDTQSVADAATAGQSISVPYSTYVEHIHGTKWHEKINPFVRDRETDRSTKEIEADAEDGAEAELTLEDVEQQQVVAEQRIEGRKQVETQLFDALNQDSRVTNSQARAQAAVTARMFDQEARKWSGSPAFEGRELTAVDMMNLRRLEIGGEEVLEQEAKLEVEPVLGQGEVEEIDVAPAPDTEEFAQWFGDSPVVDEAGQPLVVRHTTSAPPFEAFDPSRIGEGTPAAGTNIPPGFHFSTRQDQAYGENTIEAYVSLQNPKIVTPDELTQGMASEALAAGHDGFIISWGDGSQQVIATKPNQIKAITNERPTAESDNIFEQPGFHGGQADIARFSVQYIGEGEGHSLRGHGLYFAEEREVAEHYREMVPVWKRNKYKPTPIVTVDPSLYSGDVTSDQLVPREQLASGRLMEMFEQGDAEAEALMTDRLIWEIVDLAGSRPVIDTDIDVFVNSHATKLRNFKRQNAAMDPSIGPGSDRIIRYREEQQRILGSLDGKADMISYEPALPFGMKVQPMQAALALRNRLLARADELEAENPGLAERTRELENAGKLRPFDDVTSRGLNARNFNQLETKLVEMRRMAELIDSSIVEGTPEEIELLTPPGDPSAAIRTGPQDLNATVIDIGNAYDIEITDLADPHIANPGQLYEVDVPEKQDLIFWDGTLDLQSEEVRDALSQIFDIDQAESGAAYQIRGMSVRGDEIANLDNLTTGINQSVIDSDLDGDTILFDPSAGDLYRLLANYFGGWNPPAKKLASNALFELTGLKGLHFLDQESRPVFENRLTVRGVVEIGGTIIVDPDTELTPVERRVHGMLLQRGSVVNARRGIERDQTFSFGDANIPLAQAAQIKKLDEWVEQGIEFKSLSNEAMLEGTTSNFVIWDDDSVEIQRTFYQDNARPVENDMTITQEQALPIDHSKMSENAKYLTVSQILDDKEALPEIKATGRVISGKPSVTRKDLAKHFAERVQRAYGGPLQMNNETSRLMAQLMAHEAKSELARKDNAKDWYDNTMKEAIEYAGLTHPEIANDTDHHFIYTLILAITSNGASVKKNASQALEMYEKWAKTGKIPIRGIGPQAGAIKGSLRDMQKLIDAKGIPWVEEFMNTQFEVGELNAYGIKAKGELTTEIMPGSIMLGPKIGAFFQNLNGNFSPLTMDRWFMRTMGRMRGDILNTDPMKLEKKIKSFRSEVRKNRDYIERFTDLDVNEILTDDLTAEEASREVVRQFTKKSFKNGLPIEHAANAVFRVVEPKLAPEGGRERHWIRQSLELAQHYLRADGINLDNASLQAVLWFAEQDLYNKLGSRVQPKTDYSAQNRALAEGRGIDAGEVEQATERAHARAESIGRPGAVGRDRQRLTRYLSVHEARRLLHRSTGRAGSRKETGPYGRRDQGRFAGKRALGNKDVHVSKLTMDGKIKNRFIKAGMDPVELWELKDKDRTDPGAGMEAAKIFKEGIEASKVDNKFGPSVFVYEQEEYAGMRLLITPDKRAGIAVNGDDIISAFSSTQPIPGVKGGGKQRQEPRAMAMLMAGIQMGGRRLDAFDTVLPDLYATAGFRVVARQTWNEEFKPKGWSKKTFRQYNKGEPDVVYMVYDPQHWDEYSGQQEGEYVSGYDDAVRIQAEEVSRLWGKPRTLYQPPPKSGVGRGTSYNAREEARLRAEAKARSWDGNEEFEAWTQGYEVIYDMESQDYGGSPIVVVGHHGTTHDLEEVNIDLGNPENYLGQGFYASSSYADAVENYAGIGPDMTARIQERAEEIFNLWEEFNAEEFYDIFVEELDSLQIDLIDVQVSMDGAGDFEIADFAEQIAIRELTGGQPAGQVRTTFLKMRQPFTYSERGAGNVMSNQYMDFLITFEDEESGTEEGMSDELDGMLSLLDELAQDFHFNVDGARNSLLTLVIDTGNAVSTSEFMDWMKENFQDSENLETGKSATSEMIKAMLTGSGYDGIIQIGAGRRFRGMDEVNSETVHAVSYNEVNIKDVENAGGFALGTAKLLEQPKDLEGPRGGIEFLNNGDAAIRLTESRDLSSFMHEASHLFLQLRADMIRRFGEENTPESVLTDWNITKDWFADSATDLLGWVADDKNRQRLIDTYGVEAVQRVFDRGVRGVEDQAQKGDVSSRHGHQGVIAEAMHEYWASNFETYMQTGGAPTVELESAFSSFRAWLTEVYQGIRGEVTPEIRDVFDRLIAAEEEITRSDNELNYKAIESIEQMGMSREETDRYREAILKARDEARKQADRIIINEKLKEQQRQWKERREVVEGEVREEFQAQPIYRVNEFLRKGTLFDPEEALPQDPGKLSDDILKETWPPEMLKRLPSGRRGVRAKNGQLVPAETAYAFGLSEDELIKGLSGLQPLNQVVREETDRRMDEETQLSASEMAKELDSVQHRNEARERALALEHVAIRRMLKDEVEAGARSQVAREGPGEAEDIRAQIQAAQTSLEAAQETREPEAIEAALVELQRLQALRRASAEARPIADRAAREARRGAQAEAREASVAARAAGREAEAAAIERQAGLDREEQAEAAVSRATDREAEDARKESRTAEREVRRLHDSIRAAARHEVEGTVVGKLRVGKYRAAEQRAARAERTAIARRDWDAAEEAMYQRIYNYHAYDVALELEAQGNKDLRFVQDKSVKVPRRKRPPGTSPVHVEQMMRMIDQFDLRKGTSVVKAEARQALSRANNFLKGYMNMLGETGEYIQIPQHEFSRFDDRTSYKLMTFPELTELREAVESIAHQDSIAIKRQKEERQATVEAARAELVEATEATGIAGRKVKQGPEGPKFGGLKHPFSTFHAIHTKMEYLFRWLDGGENLGPIWRRWYEPFNRAADEENSRVAGYGQRLSDMYKDTWTVTERAKWGMPIVSKKHYEVVNQKLSHPEILSIAMNWGNERNRSAIMTSFNWTYNQVAQLLDEALEEKDWTFVQNVLNMIDELWPESRDMHKQMTGITAQKESAAPIHTRFGTLKGGYYPLNYDPDSSLFISQKQEEEAVKGLMGGHASSKQTKAGHLKERIDGGATGKKVKLDLAVIEQHVTQVLHDITHRRAVVEASHMLSDRAIQQEIKDAFGAPMLKRMHSWLQAIATGDQQQSVEGAGFLRRMQAGTTVMAMGWNLGTSLMQPAGFFKTVKHLGEAYTLKGLYAYMGQDWMNGNSQNRSWNPIREHMIRNQEFIFNRSKMMQERSQNFDRDIRQAHKNVGAGAVLPASEMALWMIGYTQSFVDQATWLGAYAKAMDGNASEIEMGNEADAISFADQAVRFSQSHGDVKDLAAVQRGGPHARLFTMFYSFFSSQYNDLADELQWTVTARRVMAPRLIANLFWIAVMPVVYEELVKSVGRDEDFGPDDDDDRGDVAFWFAKILAYNAGSAVFVRNVVSSWESGFKVDFTPSLRPLGSLAKLLSDAEEGDFDAGFWRETGYVIGAVSAAAAGYPIPSVKALQHTDTLIRWMSGDFHPGDLVKPPRGKK